MNPSRIVGVCLFPLVTLAFAPRSHAVTLTPPEVAGLGYRVTPKCELGSTGKSVRTLFDKDGQPVGFAIPDDTQAELVLKLTFTNTMSTNVTFTGRLLKKTARMAVFVTVEKHMFACDLSFGQSLGVVPVLEPGFQKTLVNSPQQSLGTSVFLLWKKAYNEQHFGGVADKILNESLPSDHLINVCRGLELFPCYPAADILNTLTNSADRRVADEAQLRLAGWQQSWGTLFRGKDDTNIPRTPTNAIQVLRLPQPR